MSAWRCVSLQDLCQPGVVTKFGNAVHGVNAVVTENCLLQFINAVHGVPAHESTIVSNREPLLSGVFTDDVRLIIFRRSRIPRILDCTARKTINREPLLSSCAHRAALMLVLTSCLFGNLSHGTV